MDNATLDIAKLLCENILIFYDIIDYQRNVEYPNGLSYAEYKEYYMTNCQRQNPRIKMSPPVEDKLEMKWVQWANQEDIIVYNRARARKQVLIDYLLEIENPMNIDIDTTTNPVVKILNDISNNLSVLKKQSDSWFTQIMPTLYASDNNFVDGNVFNIDNIISFSKTAAREVDKYFSKSSGLKLYNDERDFFEGYMYWSIPRHSFKELYPYDNELLSDKNKHFDYMIPIEDINMEGKHEIYIYTLQRTAHGFENFRTRYRVKYNPITKTFFYYTFWDTWEQYNKKKDCFEPTQWVYNIEDQIWWNKTRKRSKSSHGGSNNRNNRKKRRRKKLIDQIWWNKTRKRSKSSHGGSNNRNNRKKRRRNELIDAMNELKF